MGELGGSGREWGCRGNPGVKRVMGDGGNGAFRGAGETPSAGSEGRWCVWGELRLQEGPGGQDSPGELGGGGGMWDLGVQDKPQADVEMGFMVGALGCSNKPGWGMQDELGGADGAWRCRMVLGVWGAPIAWAQQCRGDSGAGTGVRVGSSIPGLAVGSVGAAVTPVSVGWRRFDIPPPPRHALRGIIAPGSSPAEGKPEPPVLPGPKPGGWGGLLSPAWG